MLNRFLAATAIASMSLGLVAVAGPAAAQQVAAAQSYGPEVFGRLPFMQGPEISPNGKLIAAKLRVSGEQYLAIVDLANPSARPAMIAKDGAFDKLDDVVIDGWEWADDDNLIIQLSSRQEFFGEKYDAVRMIGFNRISGKTTPLAWDGAVSSNRILWKSREGNPRILVERISAQYGFEGLSMPEVVEVDVLTGRHKIVMKPNPEVSSWFADGNGVVRMGVKSSRDTGKTRILYRSGPDGTMKTVQNARTSRYDDGLVPSIFLKEPDKALVINNASGFSELYELDLKTMALGKKVFSTPGFDIGAAIPNPDGDALEGVYAVDVGSRFHWFDGRLKSVQGILDESFGAGQARIVSADRDRQRLVLSVGGPHQAGAFYLYDTNTGKVTRLAWVNEALKDAKLNPVKTITYKASDGKDIPAVLTLPRGREAKNLPLIVLPHGGPWARDYERYDHWAQALADMGYVVVQPNFRGSTGYGKAWTELADGNWGQRMQDDLNDSITALAAQGIVDSKRVCMFGWSYGGYAASRAAQRDGSKYRCTISGAGVHDIPAMVRYDRNYLGRYGSTFIGGAAPDLRSVSPALHPSQFSAPIMIVHGANDVRVPVSQSRELVRALKAAGKKEGVDFVYLEQPRNTHNLPLEEDRVQLLQEIKKFLDKHNPA